MEAIEAFRKELNMIDNTKMQQLAILALGKTPEYFVKDCPSSSTGKYHHPSEHGPLGTVLHSRRVVSVVVELARAMDLDHCKNELIIAAILHDSVKYGWEKGRYTVKDHPELAAKMFGEVYKEHRDLASRDSALAIYNAILFHSGQCGVGKSSKPLESFLPYEMCMHLADIVASRNHILVEV